MKKAKRYQYGGTAEEDKKRGLEASKDERVGFFERLRMGNIDDPKSEAYKRFGAGRGAAERTKVLPPAPSIRSTDSGMGVPGFGAPVMPKAEAPMPERMPASMPVGLRSAIEGAGVGEGGAAPKVMEKETTTVKTPSKTVTQTKKAVAKPSMKYSDKEAAEDLDREMKRGSRVPATPKTSELRAVTRARTRAGTPVKEDTIGKTRAGTATTTSDGMLPILAAGALGSIVAGMRNKRKQELEELDSGLKASGGRYGGRQGKYIQEIDPMFTDRAGFEQGPMKKGGKVKAKPVKKYASGGMVGKASKRADGIAKKGKTKGRII